MYSSNVLVDCQRKHTLLEMMRSKNYSIVSLESEIPEDVNGQVEKAEEEKLLARRRYMHLVCIPPVFIISFSVVLEVQARERSE